MLCSIIVSCTVPAVMSFVPPSSPSQYQFSATKRSVAKSQPFALLHMNGQESDDLFDPLLSPHSYPDGIDSGVILDSSESNANPIDSGDPILDSSPYASVIGNGSPVNSSSDDSSAEDNSLDFDPLLSPHSYPRGTKAGPVPSFSELASFSEGTPAFSASNDVGTFDPLLSPHSYPDGTDAGPVPALSEAAAMSSTPETSLNTAAIPNEISGNESAEEEEPLCDVLEVFDPLLSPHSYPNGIPSISNNCLDSKDASNNSERSNLHKRTKKLGILLIDHGSKRQASNDNLHSIAKMYQSRLDRDENQNGNTIQVGSAGKSIATVVRGAHMEIATPSILTSLRKLLVEDQVEKIVCVPYFLSPGRHATVDVPNLIAEAKTILGDEGLLGGTQAGDGGKQVVEVLVSNALGSHLESMLGAVDDLVEWTLKEQGETL